MSTVQTKPQDCCKQTFTAVVSGYSCFLVTYSVVYFNSHPKGTVSPVMVFLKGKSTHEPNGE